MWRNRGRLLFIVALILSFTLSVLTPDDAFCRGGGFRGGGFRGGGRSSGMKSFGRSSSAPKSPSSSGSGWFGKKPSRAATRMGAGTTADKMDMTDRALADKSKASGRVFRSRDEAKTAFEKDYADKFPNKFDREPSTRPDYIPNSTDVDGKQFPVSWNPAMGGYGYYGPGGGWVAYSVMRDLTMMSLLMNHHGYGYGPYDDYGYHRSTSGIWLGLFIVGFIIVIAMVIARRNKMYVQRR